MFDTYPQPPENLPEPQAPTFEEGLLEMIRPEAECAQAGKHVSVQFNLLQREGDEFTLSPEYEGRLLSLEDGDEPCVIVGEVTCDAVPDVHGVMTIPLTELGIFAAGNAR